MEEATELHAVQRLGSLIAGVLVAAAAAFGPVAPAFAQGDAEAKQRAAKLIDEGNGLFEQKQFEAALKKYEAAYEAYQSPKILLNLAEAHRALGYNDRAARAYEQFLAETDEGSAAKQRRLANQRLEEILPQLGHIAIESEREGVQVWIDGVEAGRTPLEPIRVEPGRREVRAEAEGFEPFRDHLMVPAGQTEPMKLALVSKNQNRAGMMALDPDRTQTTPSIVAPEEPTTVRTEADGEPLTSKWWVWAIAGVVVVAGVGIGIAAASGGDDFVPAGELSPTGTSQWERFLIGRDR